MAIDPIKLAVSAGMGLADEVAIWWDDERAKESGAAKAPFRTVADMVRLGGTVVGLALQTMTQDYERVGEAMSLACLPLLIKSVRDVVVRGTEIGTAMGRREFVPRQVVRAPSLAATHSSYGWKPRTIETG